MNKRIVLVAPTLAPSLTKSHIFKDICIIPILLQENYGYEATIITDEIDEEYYKSMFPKLKIIVFKEDYFKSVIEYFTLNSYNYDLLFMFGPYQTYEVIGSLYKVNNPKGKIYLKCDMNRMWLNSLVAGEYFDKLINICDLISVESKQIQYYLNNKYNKKFEYISNGFYEIEKSSIVDYSEKENTIITVGRLGTKQKNTELLLESFMLSGLYHWKLKLVGSIEEDFYEVLKRFENYPMFKNVEILGVLDKESLDKEYRKAKIFAMTSKIEAAAHVYSEAGKNGCYIVSTDVDGIKGYIDNGRFGTITECFCEPIDYADVLRNVAVDEKMLKEVCPLIQEHIRNEFHWNVLVGKVKLLIDEMFEE